MIFEDLKRQFGVLPCEDMGDCIVIPAEQLDLDWVLLFLEEGYRFEGTRLEGHPVVLVAVNKLEMS